MKPKVIAGVLATTLAMAAAGCGKKSEPENSGAQDAAAETVPVGRPGTAQVVQPAVPQVNTGASVDIPEIQRALMRWLRANRRRPADFEDFAATAGVAIPPPPAGKKYVITKEMRIVLVNR